ncbi:PmoA family protein [Microbacteriaceae bacterium VKM Ac-2854]|nr:PmoA family protein [Microbacteriaceae bacterium VKM Ac-2854]
MIALELPEGVGRLVLADPELPAIGSPRPYVHPLRTPDGRVVSDFRPADHDWHWGLSLAIANIRIGDDEPESNLWGGVTWVADGGYRQLDNNGSQRSEGGDRFGWFDARGRRFLSERRRHTVRTAGDAVVLTIESDWTAQDAAVRFGSPTTAGRPGAGYGGLFLRLDPSFSGAQAFGPGGGVAMGESAPWLALMRGATVAMWADPGNPVHPSPWFVRTEATPMLCAAPFFHETWTLEPGATASWRWQVLLADSELDPERIEARW